MNNFSESRHPMFRASSALEGGELRSKEGSKKFFHFNGSDENIELLIRTVISGNQLSVYGAVADLRNEVSEGVRSQGNLKHLIIWKRLKFLRALLLQKLIPTHSNGETWCKITSENSNKCLKTRNYPNYALMLV